MSVCPSCGKDNQARYLFCLGCGAQLPSTATQIPTAGPNAATLIPDEAAKPQPTSRTCTSCRTAVAPRFKFCPNCGALVDDEPGGMTTEMPTAGGKILTAAAPSGQLVLIRPDGTEGGQHPIVEGENRIGRSASALFEADGYLSPVHAELVLNAAGLVLRDINSQNGVYLKLTGEEELLDGDVFRIGQELLRFDAIPPPQPLDDGTEVLGSPNPGYWGRLAVIIGRDQDGSAFPLFNDTILIGRERGDLTFPEDGYVSGAHAQVSLKNGRYFLTDLNSSNGSFIRLRGERVIPSGSLVLMGQQLFRVTYT